MNKHTLLDVIVRFHDLQRLHELSRCIFSLVCQDYRPIRIILVTQRFTWSAIEETLQYVSPALSLDKKIDFQLVNFDKIEPKDARSDLINLGISKAAGRFLAFLDYDDIIYPDAYTTLIEHLLFSPAAIAFGGIAVKQVCICADTALVLTQTQPFKGEGVLDLFQDNFCPIHSFVIDKKKIDEKLYFDPKLNRLEDYDFLLRFCSRFLSDFKYITKIIGAYYYKNDGSNTILYSLSVTDKQREEWIKSSEVMDECKKNLLVSLTVQKSIGITNPDQLLTIQKLLEMNGKSPKSLCENKAD